MISEITLELILIINCIVLYRAVFEIQKLKNINKGLVKIIEIGLDEGDKIKVDVEKLKTMLHLNNNK